MRIEDIAERAGVSIATVSRVINDKGGFGQKTREKVEQVIKEMNYTPNAIAQSLSKNSTDTIGVVIPDINNPFFSKIVKGITRVADERKLNIILCDTNDNIEKEQRALEMLLKYRVKGLIISVTTKDYELKNKTIMDFKNSGIPVILVDRELKYYNLDGVFLDNFYGAMEATQLLIDNKHKDIAIISGPQSSKPGQDRLQGYLSALESNKIKIDEKKIYYGDFKIESGYNIAKEMFKDGVFPKTLFVCNNQMSLGVIKAVYERGLKIPEEVNLVSFDEIELIDIFNLKISVVYVPAEEMGEKAVEILLKKDEGGNSETVKIMLKPKLIKRGSEI